MNDFDKTFVLASLFLELFMDGLGKGFGQCFVAQDTCDQYRACFLRNTGEFFCP